MSNKKTTTKPAVKAPEKQTNIDNNSSGMAAFILKLQGKKAFYFVLAILGFIGFIVFNEFLLLNKVFLYKDIGSDSLNAYYPFFIHTWHYIKQYGTLSWSFNMGMGQNATTFAFYYPFNFLLYPFGRPFISWLLGYKQFFEVILAGIVFYKYLCTIGRSFYPALIGSVMFAFCGFTMVGTAWNSSLEALIAVFFLLGFEQIFYKNKPWLFIATSFLVAVSGPFDFVVFAIFLLGYAIFRYFQDQRKGAKGFATLIVKLVGFGILGILLSAPVLIEHIKIFLESPRVEGGDSLFTKLFSAPMFGFIDSLQLGTAIHRFFSSESLGTGSDYKGWVNIFEAPTFYCGIPCLLLVPVLFANLEKKQIKLFAIVLGITLLPMVFPWFRQALWFFSGDYYRDYSLFVALVFIVFSAMSIDFLIKGRKLNMVVLIISAVVLILVRKLNFFTDENIVNSKLETAVDFFVVAYAAILFWISRQADKAMPMMVFFTLLVFEMTWFSYISVNRGNDSNITAAEMEQRTGYFDYSTDAVDFLKKTDKSFYRIDKDYGSSLAKDMSLNDGMVQDYYGTSGYSSFNQKYYIQYLRAYGVIGSKENESRWCIGLFHWPALENINDVKYLLYKDLKKIPKPDLQDSVGTFGNITVIRNKMTLPLGFCYSKFIKFSDFEKLSFIRKNVVSLRAAVVNDEDMASANKLKEFYLKDTLSTPHLNSERLKILHDSLAQDTLTITDFQPTKITGHLNLKSDKLLYLSIPYDKGWHCNIDGKEQQPLLIANGMMGLLPGTGEHTIQLEYRSQYRAEATWVSIFGLFALGGLIVLRRRKEKGR